MHLYSGSMPSWSAGDSCYTVYHSMYSVGFLIRLWIEQPFKYLSANRTAFGAKCDSVKGAIKEKYVARGTNLRH